MLKKGDILIIEDDSDDRDYIEEVFVELEVTNSRKYVANAYDALEYIKAHSSKPFIVISDINMPMMNGFDLRKIILENSELTKKYAPYIFLSTSNDEAWVNKAYELSVQGYFQKPSIYSDLKKTVQQILDYWNNSLTPVV